MIIVNKKLSSIKPYGNNPRANDKAVEKVANSIREFGFQQPIVVDGDMVVVAGHTRLLAAQLLGLKTVPCVVAKELTPTKARAYRIADNKVGELADWDLESLCAELGDMNDGEFDWSDFGFTSDELDGLLSGPELMGGDEPPDIEDDEEDEDPVSVVNEAYLLGDHILVCRGSALAECDNLRKAWATKNVGKACKWEQLTPSLGYVEEGAIANE